MDLAEAATVTQPLLREDPQRTMGAGGRAECCTPRGPAKSRDRMETAVAVCPMEGASW